ncbi:hypothetical protein CTheo_4089 [Ceratobasidium theobromae]|uniref:Uncharacterized protein n=1 Tax=Ceratobasidium theobromae TaxID=1582974 RepID=A0A5N5QL08_9AGAM|nr:hypothetical protein CTheo_4089 [Ceratobasidium theobromae]
MLRNDGAPTQEVPFPGANASDFRIIEFLMEKFNLPTNSTTAIKVSNLVLNTRRLKAIVKACVDGDFNRVHQGKVLKDRGVCGETKNPLECASTDVPKDHGDPEILRRLEMSFRREYVGAAADGLYEYLERNDRLFGRARATGKEFYGKFCSIVQSSGTGKSRAMIELRTKGVIVLYMNLRNRREEYTFPERDDIIADILTGRRLKDGQWTSSPPTVDEYRNICYALFTAIFRVLKSTFKGYLLTMGDSRRLIDHWNNEMCNLGSERRKQWFEEVKNEYDNVGEECEAIIADSKAFDDSLSGLGSGSGKEALIQAFNAWERFASKKLVLDSNPNHPRLVIGVDEAHMLSDRKKYHPSHLLCRVINDYSKYSCSTWVLFASTTLQAPYFSPPVYDSDRISQGGPLQFPPYVHLGWDQNAQDIRELDPDNVAKLDYIAHLGRPLWISLMNAMDAPMLLQTAAEKLCNDPTYDPYDEDQVLAVLGARFCVDIRLEHLDSNQFNTEAVTNHMRILKSITPDRNSRSTSYPSEPLLACVAAKCLHGTNESLDLSLEVLYDKFLDGMVETGNGGELFSRLLLLLGKDLYCRTSATQPKNILTNDNELLDCVPIPVVGYLRFMFGEHIISEDEKRLDGWYINFTHWISMASDIWNIKETLVARQDFAKLHWYRTSAVECCQKQPAINKVIPIYYKGSQSRFSHILISDRVGDGPSKTRLGSITHKAIFGYDSSEPYVVILLDMGLPASEPATSCECEWGPSSCSPCRIYAPGINTTSLPFLKNYPNVLAVLTSMIAREQTPDPTPIASELVGQFAFGKTVGHNNMLWFIGPDKYEDYEEECF